MYVCVYILNIHFKLIPWLPIDSYFLCPQSWAFHSVSTLSLSPSCFSSWLSTLEPQNEPLNSYICTSQRPLFLFESVLLVLFLHAQPHNTYLLDFRSIYHSCPIMCILWRLPQGWAFSILADCLESRYPNHPHICVCWNMWLGWCLCVFWQQILHPLGVMGGMHCKQISVGISKSLEHMLYTIVWFSLSHTHIQTLVPAFTHTFLFVDQKF